MTRIWTGTAAVVSGYTTVVLTGDPLSAANCPLDATLVLGGLVYFVADADYPTMTVELTRAYEGGDDASISAEIDPMTAETSSRTALTLEYTAYNARLQLLDADGKGLFYTILSETGANDPGPGKIARDADWATATELYLDVLDAGGKSAASLVDEWDTNSVITVRSISSRAYAAYRVLAAPQDMTGWRLVAVEYIGGDGILADGEDVAVAWNPVGSLTLAYDAQVDEVADLAQFVGEEEGFSVLVSDTGDGTPGIYSLDTSASPADWVGPALVQGLPGNGLRFDAQVDDIASRAAYDAEADGFAVLVSDVGDGRAAIYVMGDGGSADWSAPAYVTGEPGAGVPAGGTIGQVLTKASGADYDTTWSDPAVTVPFTGASASNPASMDFAEDTDNGTNKITVAAPSSVDSDKTLTLLDVTGTLLAIATASLPVTDNRVPRFDGVTGLIQPSLIEIDDNGAIVSLARFLGTVSETSSGADRIDIGVVSSTPRMVFENFGATPGPPIWEVDVSITGAFRWFTPGVVQMQLDGGSILTLPVSTAEINLGHATDTTITRLAAGEIAVEAKRLAWSTAPVTKTADFTWAANESSIINNKSGSACVATLPSAASYPGRRLRVKNGANGQALNSAGSNVVPIAGGSAGTAILSANAGRWADLESDATNWVIMAGVI